jgi:hypothetical protein
MFEHLCWFYAAGQLHYESLWNTPTIVEHAYQCSVGSQHRLRDVPFLLNGSGLGLQDSWRLCGGDWGVQIGFKSFNYSIK